MSVVRTQLVQRASLSARPDARVRATTTRMRLWTQTHSVPRTNRHREADAVRSTVFCVAAAILLVALTPVAAANHPWRGCSSTAGVVYSCDGGQRTVVYPHVNGVGWAAVDLWDYSFNSGTPYESSYEAVVVYAGASGSYVQLFYTCFGWNSRGNFIDCPNGSEGVFVFVSPRNAVSAGYYYVGGDAAACAFLWLQMAGVPFTGTCVPV